MIVSFLITNSFKYNIILTINKVTVKANDVPIVALMGKPD